MSEKVSRLGDENGVAQEARRDATGDRNSPLPAAAEACQVGDPSCDERANGHGGLAPAADSHGRDAVDPQRLSFDELLVTLGLVDGDFIAVCHQPVGGTFQAQVTSCGNSAAAVRGLPEPSCVWFTPNPTAGPERKGQGRGRERDVKRWVALYTDLDVKAGAFRDIAQAQAFVDVLSTIIGTRPTVVIFSGHGLQPIWVIEDARLDDEVSWALAYRLMRQFGRLVTSAAHNFCGAKLDNVFNMDRLLRVPGTLNLKDPNDPVPTGAVIDNGRPLTMDAVEEFLDAYGASALESDQPVSGEVVVALEDWKFGKRDCPYAQKMVAAWNQESDRPKAGRHKWAIKKSVRLAAAHRRGCFTEDGLTLALEYLQDALAHWCSVVGDPRPLQHREVESAYRWATKRVSSFTDEQVEKELGNHRHHNRPKRAATAAVESDATEDRASRLEDVPLEDGAELLDEVVHLLRRYVVLPDEHAVIAVALWIAATHGIACWNAAPRLVINSPQKRCGKTRTLDVIAGMCHRPLVTVNATAAAIFRSLAGDHPPTLIIDEADTIFGTKRAAEQNEELRALLNAGHQRNKPALRCVGPQQTPTEFPTFAMAALAGIGNMPDTVTDRGVNITMRRRMFGEQVSQFRARRDEPMLHRLRDRLAVWAQAHAEELTNAVPDMPVEDRAADTWEPLIALADVAGGRWPETARAACIALVAGADDAQEDRSIQIRLLTDIRRIFTQNEVDFFSSTALVQQLKSLTDSPWSDWNLTTSRLAHDLAPFGVRPGHNVEKTVRGYRLESFHDAFQRYTRPEPSAPSGTDAEQR